MDRRIKIVFYTMLILFLLSCIPVRNIDPVLQKYYDRTLENIQIGCPTKSEYNHTRIIFGDLSYLGSGILGVCTFYGNGFTIVINESSFYTYTDTEDLKYALVAHEVMHCLMGYKHIDDPNNLMNPYLTYINSEDVDRQVVGLSVIRCHQ